MAAYFISSYPAALRVSWTNLSFERGICLNNGPGSSPHLSMYERRAGTGQRRHSILPIQILTPIQNGFVFDALISRRMDLGDTVESMFTYPSDRWVCGSYELSDGTVASPELQKSRCKTLPIALNGYRMEVVYSIDCANPSVPLGW